MPKDDTATVCAIGALGTMIANVLHEGVGHALIALLTGAKSGVLSTVAWSSASDTRLVAAGGTLVNLIAGLACWIALRAARRASVRVRFFLFITSAFNLLSGTGYFLFSGVTNFGDWAVVTAGLQPAWAWRTLLMVVGAAAYFTALRFLGLGLVRFVGVPAKEGRRILGLTIPPYVTAISLAGVASLFNPIGFPLVWQSALPATAGANAGLLWLRYYAPKGAVPDQAGPITRGPGWIAAATAMALLFIVVLGRGVTLHAPLADFPRP
jgi:hypothetical protein